MATSITIKGLPPELHQALKARAVRHGRSLNQEIIQCLRAASSLVSKPDIEEELAQVRALHRKMRAEGVWITPEEIEQSINEGRE